MLSLRGVLKFSLVLMSVAGQAVAGAAPAQALLQPLQWRSVGPFRGGRVLTVAGVPGEPHHFYFGAVNGGVWESRDVDRCNCRRWLPRES